MARILVLGAHGNAARNYAKCLKMGGHIVYGADIDTDFFRPTPDCYSGKIKWIPEFKAGTVYERADEIRSFVESNGIEFIHPQPEEEVEFLYQIMSLEEWYPRFAPYVWPLRSTKVCFDDKLWTVKNYLESRYPDQPLPIYVSDRYSIENLAGKKVWARQRFGAGSKGSEIIYDVEQFVGSGFAEEPDYMFTEYLPGPEFSVHTFWIDGQLVHSQGRERVEYMCPNENTGQSSSASVADTILQGHEAYDVANETILASEEKPDGIYNVDMRASESGEIFPTEVNYGRYNTTMDFFAELGVNTPSMQVDYWTKNLINVQNQVVGPGWRWYRVIDDAPTLVRV